MTKSLLFSEFSLPLARSGSVHFLRTSVFTSYLEIRIHRQSPPSEYRPQSRLSQLRLGAFGAILSLYISNPRSRPLLISTCASLRPRVLLSLPMDPNNSPVPSRPTERLAQVGFEAVLEAITEGVRAFPVDQRKPSAGELASNHGHSPHARTFLTERQPLTLARLQP